MLAAREAIPVGLGGRGEGGATVLTIGRGTRRLLAVQRQCTVSARADALLVALRAARKAALQERAVGRSVRGMGGIVGPEGAQGPEP